MTLELTILEGSTFCICDERGDIGGETTGFFADDTRFLSRFELHAQRRAAAPALVRQGRVLLGRVLPPEPARRRARPDTLSIARERFVGEGMRERLLIRNEGWSPRSRSARARGCRRLRGHLRREGARLLARRPAPRRAAAAAGRGRVRPETASSSCSRTRSRARRARTQVIFSQPGESTATAASVRYPIELAPRESWELTIDVVTSRRRGRARRDRRERQLRRRGRRTSATRSRRGSCSVPQLRATWDALHHAFDQSVADLAALRIRERRGVGKLPAAGMPWFMTVFGRDTLITCSRRCSSGPSSRARRSTRSRAAAGAPRTTRRSTPSPGRSSTRSGAARRPSTWFPRLLRHRRRDAALPRPALGGVALDGGPRRSPRELREPALRALAWIDEWGDRDGDGFVEYERRTPRGLENQSWKDSGDSQRFARRPHRAGADRAVRGAGLRLRREAAAGRARARGLARRASSRERLDAEADALQARFDEAFWVERARRLLRARARRRQAAGRLALLEHRAPALERDRPGGAGRVRSSTRSWATRSGRAGASARCRPATPAYNPLSYHNGTVWPHDNSLDRLGPRAVRPLARGAPDRAADARGGELLRLPAAGGVRRAAARRDAVPDRRTRPPRARRRGPPARRCCCSSSCSGSSPTRAAQRSRASRPASCPSGSATSGSRASAPSAASGTCGSGRRDGVQEDDASRMKVAIVSPVWFPVPPTGLRRHRVGRLAARGRARRRGPRRHPLRLRRLADEGASSPARLPTRAERVDRPDVLGAPALARSARRAPTSSTSSTTTPGLLGLTLGGAPRDAGRAHGARPAERRAGRALRAGRPPRARRRS